LSKKSLVSNRFTREAYLAVRVPANESLRSVNHPGSSIQDDEPGRGTRHCSPFPATMAFFRISFLLNILHATLLHGTKKSLTPCPD
jgi:hypothetical protein